MKLYAFPVIGQTLWHGVTNSFQAWVSSSAKSSSASGAHEPTLFTAMVSSLPFSQPIYEHPVLSTLLEGVETLHWHGSFLEEFSVCYGDFLLVSLSLNAFLVHSINEFYTTGSEWNFKFHKLGGNIWNWNFTVWEPRSISPVSRAMCTCVSQFWCSTGGHIWPRGLLTCFSDDVVCIQKLKTSLPHIRDIMCF